MDVWYEHIELTDAMQGFAGIVSPKKLAKQLAKTQHRTSAQVLTKLTEIIEGERRIRHQPPVLVPLDSPEWHDIAQDVLDRYAESMNEEHVQLLRRFRLVEIAMKVVGVGSVGTRCLIALLHGRDEDDVLFLQVKEAEHSVLAPYAGASAQDHQGERVVVGQRLMQAASDMFLGWTVGPFGNHYYVRQLRDMKGSVAHRRPAARGARALRRAVRPDTGPGTRPSARSDGDRRVPRQGRALRRGDGRVRASPTPTRPSATTPGSCPRSTTA